jgi:Fe-S-cluster containining protein
MDKLHLDPETFVDQFNKLDQIYAAIDQAYTDVASQYGFHCSGCEDNCCLTRFYHHTFLEYFYLLKGYRGLERPQQIEIREKAEKVCSALREADSNIDGAPTRLMCPLNFDGLCCLYHHRPMICRMHGLPHELRRPDGRIIQGPGCAYLEQHHGKNTTVSFDRTSFYQNMVRLEKELRLMIQADTKIKMTVAEMILAF